MSSDATAKQIYDELSGRDRAVVDAWRTLGNDLLTSILRSRVLTDGPRRRAVDDPLEFGRRMRGTDSDVVFRTACEHEAAHAVAVRHLPGVELVDVYAATGGGGLTRFRSPDDRSRAVVFAAADVWIGRMRCDQLPRGDEYGCGDDRRELVRTTNGDFASIRRAELDAFHILRENQSEVFAFAELLGQANGEPLRFGG